MTPVAVDPYWYNAAHWYMTTNPPVKWQDDGYEQYTLDFESWLVEQGATLERQLSGSSKDYHPWLYFEDPVMAMAFVLRWS